MEMSCAWVSNPQKKTSEKTTKYAPLRWELKQKYSGLVDRCGGSGAGASWEASQRCPQEDARGMPIRHTEHCTHF